MVPINKPRIAYSYAIHLLNKKPIVKLVIKDGIMDLTTIFACESANKITEFIKQKAKIIYDTTPHDNTNNVI
jgi:hypothetical protein